MPPLFGSLESFTAWTSTKNVAACPEIDASPPVYVAYFAEPERQDFRGAPDWCERSRRYAVVAALIRRAKEIEKESKATACPGPENAP